MNDFINYYELLGLKQDATKEEIKKAYRIQAKKWHPDINKDINAPQISKQLNEAKEILLDDIKRKDYDEYLNQVTSNKYNNLNKQKKNSQNNNSYKKEYTTRTITKWEYLKEYLKYYQTSKFRKLITVILVFLETIFCELLGITNYLLALFIFYTKDITSYISTITLSLYSVYTAYLIFIDNSKQINIFANIRNIIVLILIILLPELILKILVEKNPTYISNLNIYLFKKSVGYKD